MREETQGDLVTTLGGLAFFGEQCLGKNQGNRLQRLDLLAGDDITMPRDGLRRKPSGAELRARIHRIRRQKKSTLSPMRTVPLTTAYRPRSPVATSKAMADNDADAYSPLIADEFGATDTYHDRPYN
jgi:hypothetical protein